MQVHIRPHRSFIPLEFHVGLNLGQAKLKFIGPSPFENAILGGLVYDAYAPVSSIQIGLWLNLKR